MCGVIFQRAGKRQLEAACQRIGCCPEGSAVITAGFGCPCKIIFAIPEEEKLVVGQQVLGN